TCYSCQKCLLCFKEFSIYSCDCNQKTKPKASNQSNRKTIRVYSRKYIPNNLSPSQEEFFKQADDCYSSNFNQNFTVCFCSACHSKYERIKKIKSNTTDIKKLNTTNTKQLESFLYNNSSNCDSELKFKLFDLNSKKSNEPKSKALCISNDNNADKDEIDKADQITKLRQK
ncbi:3507_t:CDS:2, partial [Gigaspora margarita]